MNEVLPSIAVSEYHGGVRWAEHLLEVTNGEVIPRDYMRLADEGLPYGLGDWVFAGALYGDPAWRLAELREHATKWDFNLALAERMRALAGEFVLSAADEILQAEPDVVGFTTTFMQGVPSLAVAAELKRRRPELRVVLGGANCEGPMGHALHRNHRFVDYAVRGEGELAFPALLQHIQAATPPVDVPGVCWWKGESSIANTEAKQSVPPGIIPTPDYDEWFSVIERSPLSEYLTPYLFIEGSRGCWWGEKHHCTFCGLNSDFINFRSKPGERFWEELSYLVKRHKVLDLMASDNIIDMAYYRDVLPKMVESDWDLRLQYEAKANIQADKVALLSAAGVTTVQYGIESLNSQALKLMDKGVTGATNVRVLRDSEEQAVTVLWNYLYGFPGETAADYLPVIEQMSALVHLQPPSGATRLGLQRFSPHFKRPELGFARRTPAAFYRYVFDLPEEELYDLAYFFDCDDQGISGSVEEQLSSAVERWREDYISSSLLRFEGADGALELQDRRCGWPTRDHRITGWERVAYDGLDRPRSAESLRKYLMEQGHDIEGQPLSKWLEDCLAAGLVFVDTGSYVALATRDVPVRLSRQHKWTEPSAVVAR